MRLNFRHLVRLLPSWIENHLPDADEVPSSSNFSGYEIMKVNILVVLYSVCMKCLV